MGLSALQENICTKDTLLHIGEDAIVILCDKVRNEYGIFRIVESRQLSSAQNIRMLLTAQGVEIIRRKSENKLRQTLARIEELIVQYDVARIVLGLPLHMNTEEGDRAQKSLEFQEILKRRTGLDVILWDERLTTVEAIEVLNEAGIRREDRKKYVDKLAAVFILQDYLNNRESGTPSGPQEPDSPIRSEEKENG